MFQRIGLVMIFLLGTAFVWPPVGMAEDVIDEIPRITKEKLKGMIGAPGVTLIDVRYEKNWDKSDTKIAGAVRVHPNEMGSWVGNYNPEDTIVLYCD